MWKDALVGPYDNKVFYKMKYKKTVNEITLNQEEVLTVPWEIKSAMQNNDFIFRSLE